MRAMIMGTGKYEGLEVVAWQDAETPLYTTGERRQMHGWATDGYPIVELCRLSDHQRAIAELRDQLLKTAEQSLKATELLSVTLSERDSLRQQLAERDAELRHARQCIQHMIDQTTPLVPDPDNPGWAKRIQLDDVIAQRDKLAGLLREVMPDYAAPQGKGHLYADIDAALAEVDK